jgi:nucleoside-diphosphate-sugar epimerase
MGPLLVAAVDRAAPPRAVLITGASGHVGRILTAAWERRYALSLIDRHPPARRPGVPFVLGDTTSLNVLRPLCDGVDTVVHLAGMPSSQEGRPELWRHNVRSMWAALRAARDAGCRRLVFASSILVQGDPARPYSQSKIVSERLGERHTRTGSLSVVCLRLGRVVAKGDRQLWPGAWYLGRVLIEEDAVAAFTLAVEAPPSVRFMAAAVLSANRVLEFDLAEARTRLGYAPRMDAFDLADRKYRSLFGLLKRARMRATGRR